MAIDAQFWGSVADWSMAATAAAAVWIGRQQLIRVADESARQANVARADLMLKIDQQFEVELIESRKAIRTLENACKIEARRNAAAHNALGHGKIFSDRLTKLYDEYEVLCADRELNGGSGLLRRLFRSDPEDEPGFQYFQLMAVPYWMETVGMLTKKRLLRDEDVLDLYDAAFLSVIDCFEGHIENRRNERNDKNPKFLEYAIWLRDQASERKTPKARTLGARWGLN